MRKKNFTNLLVIGFVLFIVFIKVEVVSASADLESGISELAQQISKNMTETGKKKIAIIEFSDLDGNITAFGQFLAEELITQLFMISPGQFEVVERRQLMKVLSEQKLTMSGLLDAKAMESVGKILGIEAIVTGSIADLGNNVKVNARLIGVDTAKVFAVAATKIPKVGTVAELIKKQAAPIQIYTTSGEQRAGRSSSTTYVSRPKSKKIGPIVVTMKRLIVSSKGQVRVMFDFANQSDDTFKLRRSRNPEPNLTDEKGNDYVFKSGIIHEYYKWEKNAQVLNPTSNNNIVLYFKPEDSDIGIKDTGDYFVLFLNYVLYNPKDKSTSNYSVSFTDIKAQKP